ncbi:UDP-N-acetylmuramoyl-L-alanyl-D-glutamate--2,6-diaminopimelate ligase [Bartonella sp. LJL80]
MKLDQLITDDTPHSLLPSIEITGITADSRQVLPGYLFVALKGNKGDGGLYAADAVARGAVAILTDHEFHLEATKVPVLRVLDARHELAMAAAKFFGKQPPIVAAVTGTSGKTSVASFTRQIWKDTGFPAASIGTVGVMSPTRSEYGSLTTPDPVYLQKVLCELANEGVTHVAMEASSHGIDQRRLDGVRLAAAAFTNLGRDHLDYHPTVEDYFKAKMRLFDTLLPKSAPAIVFADDAYSQKAIEHITKSKRKVLTVGRKGDFISIRRVEHERYRQYVEFAMGNDVYEVNLPLAGDFQVSNAVVAAGLAIVTGVPEAAVFRALERLKGAPGRLELVGATKDDAPVYVDYAHKPEALEQVLLSVRPFTTGRVVLVFGCGGDRDKGKRALMGKIASKYADVVVVTDDNPRTEKPAEIRREILSAARGATEIADRRQAIRHAVSLLKAGDTLIVAGKGHEKGQIVGQEVLPFSDHQEVTAALEGRNL